MNPNLKLALISLGIVGGIAFIILMYKPLPFLIFSLACYTQRPTSTERICTNPLHGLPLS